MKSWVGSTSWLLWVVLLWTWVYKSQQFLNRRPFIFTLREAGEWCNGSYLQSFALYFLAYSVASHLGGSSVHEDKHEPPSSLPHLKCCIKPHLLLFTIHVLGLPVKISKWPLYLAHKYGSIRKSVQRQCVSQYLPTSQEVLNQLLCLREPQASDV